MTDLAPPLSAYPRPHVTVDVVAIALTHEGLMLRLVRRQQPPEAGAWALPGGYVHTDEDADAEASAHRVLAHKAGIAVRYLEQLYTFSGPGRDQRGWSISVSYLALVPEGEVGQNHADAAWVSVDALPALAFDHARIVAKALERIRGKSLYSSLPAFLLPEEFTLTELLALYERVLNQRLDQSAFRRKIEAQGLVEQVPRRRRAPGAGRPAQLYRLVRPDLHDFGKVLYGSGSPRSP